ncbi:MAG: cell envelope integrity protein TolA [Steroidobacteraceae bacterium]
MAQRTGATWRALSLSILLHAALVGLALAAWWQWRAEPASATLAIEAAVVDARELDGMPPPPEVRSAEPANAAPEPVPEEAAPIEPEPAPESVPEPQPDRTAELLAEQRQAELQRQVTEQRVAEELRAREERQRLEREAQAKRQAEAKRLAEEKRRAEEKRVAEAKLAREQAAALALQREREAELRRRLAAEERGSALRSSPAADQWKAQIRARIERAWIRPPSARPGVECEVAVTQVPGGEITSVTVERCTGGDDALRSSVEAAVYRASPLPLPPDPSLFERNLRLTFRPNE